MGAAWLHHRDWIAVRQGPLLHRTDDKRRSTKEDQPSSFFRARQ